MRRTLTFILLSCVVCLLGCSDSTNPSRKAGELRVILVDAPSAFDAVNIVVNEVSVHAADADSASGWTVLSDSSRTYDLLALTNGLSQVIGDRMLDPGHYTQIRLKLGTGSTVVDGRTTYPLVVPSGLQTGLKLNHSFDIQSNTLYSLTLDFDAARSIRLVGSDYVLSPVIRLVATQTSGTISGTILPVAAKAVASTTVGADTVSASADTTSGYFRLMALPAGTYSVHIVPGAAGFRDSTVTGVTVVAAQNTDMGTITLRNQ